MTLARLDNEVFFKKAFTDEIVFRAFVKDIVGIEVNPDKIESGSPPPEEAFQPKLGNIAFNSVGCRYDIFAEDAKRRIAIEGIIEFDAKGRDIPPKSFIGIAFHGINFSIGAWYCALRHDK